MYQCIPYDTNKKRRLFQYPAPLYSQLTPHAKKKKARNTDYTCQLGLFWRFFGDCLETLIWQRCPFPKTTDPAEERTSKGEKNQRNTIFEEVIDICA